MMSEEASAGSADFAIGYQSVARFTREYGRMFALPVGDTEAAKVRIRAAA